MEDFHLSSSASTRVSLKAVYDGEAGVSDQPEPDLDEIYKDGYFLDSASDCDWPYYATCNVNRKTGEIEFLEFVLPEETTEEK